MQITSSLGNERGLSLVEVLVMVVLVSLILIAVPASFRSATQIWEKGNRHNEVMQNALTGMEELTRELRQAEKIIDVSQSFDPVGFIEFKYEDGMVYKYHRYEYKVDAADSLGYIQHAWATGASDATPNLASNLNPLAGPLSNLSFTCYKSPGQVATIPGELEYTREIHVKMITYDEFGKVNPIPLSSRVYLRATIPTIALDFAIFGNDGVGLGDHPLYIGYNTDPDPSNVGANADIEFGQHTTVYGEIHNGLSGSLNFNNNPNDANYDPDSCYSYPGAIMLPCRTDFRAEKWWGGTAQDETETPGNHDDVYVDNSSSSEDPPLDPGIYKDLILDNNAILNLTSGTYWFNSITGQNDVSIIMDVSGGDGEVRVFVDGQVIFGNSLDSTAIVGSPQGGGAENIYFETHYGLAEGEDEPAWIMGQNAIWNGCVYAPDGDIAVTDGIIKGQLLSGGSVVVHGGNPAQAPEELNPLNATMVDYAPSSFLEINGYDYNCQ